MKTTIVVPVRHELYLKQTIDEIYQKARGEFEVIVALDNYWPNPALEDKPNLTVIHWGTRRGMRAGINAAAEIGTGDFLMKLDGHCMLDEGFDLKLQADCDSDWVVVPRRFGLDAELWSLRIDKPQKYPVDYEYLIFPNNREIHGVEWTARREAHKDVLLDEDMIFQGSCYFTHMDYFKRLVYPMNEARYGTFVNEAEEIGLSCWLSGGKVMVNKQTWYAHLYKGQGYRDKFLSEMGFAYGRIGRDERSMGNRNCTEFWFKNQWDGRIHDLSWLIERFWPVPTWPEERNKWSVT